MSRRYKVYKPYKIAHEKRPLKKKTFGVCPWSRNPIEHNNIVAHRKAMHKATLAFYSLANCFSRFAKKLNEFGKAVS